MSDMAGHESWIGRRVHNYEIVAKLGAGGMGVVYKAVDVKLDRAVALKFLPHAGGGKDKDRFLQEARAASALDHINIGTIFGIEETAGQQLFIVMAYYEGATLLDRIRRGALTPSSAVDIATQAAQGLLHAHARGIIHRDIKPSNIILTPQGVVKIVDFGLAKLSGGEALTQTGSTVGTAVYMSPEQAMGHTVDGRTDVWSLGVVLYQMLTGQLPFRGENVPSTLYAIVHHAPAPMTGAPPEVEHVIGKALAKHLSERYQDMQELLQDLRAVDGSSSLTTATMIRQDTRPEGLTETMVRPARPIRRGAIAGILAALVLCALAFSPVERRIARWLSGAPAEKHIAVLRFSNVGNDPENLELCDGLMETLTSRLSDLRSSNGSLWVVPASEVRRRKVADVTAAHREFGVTLVVTGSVQRDKHGVRLTVDLVDPAGLRQLGSAVLDDPSGDFAALEDAAVAKLARLMDVQSIRRPGKAPSAAPAAYESYLKGLGYLQRYDKAGNLDSAIRLFDEARRNDPQFALAYAGLGEAWRSQYQISRDPKAIPLATDYCNRAIQLDANLAPAYVTLGRIHDVAGQHELAVQEFQHALELEPRSAEAMQAMARADEAIGRTKEAEDLFQKATALRPDYWEGINRLGNFYYRQRRYAEAVTQFQRVIQLTPDNANAYSNLAASLQGLERWSEAQELLEKAIRMAPTYPLYSNLGLVYLHEKRFSQAADMFEKALQLNDKDYRVWSNLTQAYLESQANSKVQIPLARAVTLAEGLVKVHPEDAILQANLGRLYSWLNRRDEALLRVRAAMALAPNDTQVLNRVAETYARLGMLSEAVDTVNHALAHGFLWKQLEHSYGLQALLKDPRLQHK